jgi:cytidylate kinase
VLKDVRLRDEQDSEREIDPLVKNPQAFGYFVLNDSEMSEEETIRIIIKEVEKIKQ